MTKRFATVVFGLVVLSVPHVADAECAWVLWVMPFAPVYEYESQGADGRPQCMKRVVENRLPSPPYVRAAYPTHAECLRALHASGSDVMVDGWDGSRRLWSDAKMTCLPDTIDPRGPKSR